MSPSFYLSQGKWAPRATLNGYLPKEDDAPQLLWRLILPFWSMTCFPVCTSKQTQGVYEYTP
jgi:hypothetical protein